MSTKNVLLLSYSEADQSLLLVPRGPAKPSRTLTPGREELKKPLPDCKHKLFAKILATKHNIVTKSYTMHAFALETGG